MNSLVPHAYRVFLMTLTLTTTTTTTTAKAGARGPGATAHLGEHERRQRPKPHVHVPLERHICVRAGEPSIFHFHDLIHPFLRLAARLMI